MSRHSDPTDTWTIHGYNEQGARKIIAWLRSEKRRLLRRPRMSLGTSAEKLNVPRHARNVVQKKARRFRKERVYALPKNMLVAKYRDVPLLDGLYPNRAREWKPVHKRQFGSMIPLVMLKDFSFVKNPVGTMQMLAEVIRVEGVAVQARLDFSDRECLDIGPFLLLQEIRRHIAPVYVGGAIHVETQRVIDAVGLRTALQMKPFSNVADHDGIWPFRLRQRRPANSSRSSNLQLEPQKKEAVADEFIAKVDEWLGVAASQKLTLEGRRLVQKMMGEALDNAERHSQLDSVDGDWAMTGYLVQRVSGAEKLFRIHLAMLSVGTTIAESIMQGPPEMLARMNEYVSRHSGKRFSEEVLRTVFALQDGVTKDKNAAAEGRGGTGFQDIFTFFADLGAPNTHLHKAEMVIISGSTCVRLCHPYMHGFPKNGNLNTERELWFNEPNVPAEPPVAEHVFSLPNRLRGTLISMAIPLDTDYLEATADVGD